MTILKGKKKEYNPNGSNADTESHVKNWNYYRAHVMEKGIDSIYPTVLTKKESETEGTPVPL